MKKIIAVLIPVLLCFISVSGAVSQHVNFSPAIDDSGDNPVLVVNVTVDDGWHIYGLEMPSLGDDAGVPDPTSLSLELPAGVNAEGPLQCTASVENHFDSFMNLNLPWLSGSFQLRQVLHVEAGAGGTVNGTVRYMACTESACTPPERFSFSIQVGQLNAGHTVTQAEDEIISASGPSENSDVSSWWEPVETTHQNGAQSYWMILLMGFIGGLVALMTPCIWPMIPMTVSFFLKRNKSRGRAIADALGYAGSIVVIFLGLGIAMTLLFGPGELNKIATGAVFNLIFFAMLIFFAVSFFGAFEITLPEKWTNAADSKASTAGGLLGIFFMAFTLVLVSFSCTGPIIGTLLVEAFSQSNLMGPLLGMGGFAAGLALPFGLFAFFPSMLSGLPRSGGWLNSVKVVLGFVELILSLKFLSVADLAYGWRILDREVFLSIWIVLFILLGLYLLGKLRFSHDAPQQHTSVPRFFMALISFSFAVYLVPGLWGAPLKAVSAFAPPLYTQDFNLYGGTIHQFNDYDEGMAYATREGKPVMVDFSGYACVNCRKMEGTVFDSPTVRGILDRDVVMIVLMVDDKASLPEPMTVQEDGRSVILETVGEKWSYLQRHKFSTNQQPFYIMLDNEGQPLGEAREYNENIAEFVAWLENGIEVYKNK